MNRSLLFLSNTNVFSILSPLFLHEFQLNMVNLRYRNEDLSREDQIIQQIKETRLDYFYQKGIIKSKNDFVFNEHLAQRIHQAIRQTSPGLIFFEMKTKKEQEWAVLHYLKESFDIPVVVVGTSILPGEEEQITSSLLELGVKEVISFYNKTEFIQIAKRHFKQVHP